MLLLRRSVLTEKIARRGYHLTREYDVDPLEVLFVEEVMQTDIRTFDAELSAASALALVSDLRPDMVEARRQMLYPVTAGPGGGLRGIVTRTQLETAMHHGAGRTVVAELAHREPIVAHPDETLRTVVTRMAAGAVDRMPVVDRHDPARIVGVVSLTMLLAARLRDLQEARDTERVLRVRVARSRPAAGGRHPHAGDSR